MTKIFLLTVLIWLVLHNLEKLLSKWRVKRSGVPDAKLVVDDIREVLNKRAISSLPGAGIAFRRLMVAQIGISASFWPGFEPCAGFPRAFLRPQDAVTPCGGNNRLASTRLASANKLSNGALFLAKPR